MHDLLTGQELFLIRYGNEQGEIDVNLVWADRNSFQTLVNKIRKMKNEPQITDAPERRWPYRHNENTDRRPEPFNPIH